jgi:hypothetical protein
VRAHADCPYCGSQQPFPLRQRPHPARKDVIEVYISCTRCPYEYTIRASTKRMESLLKRESILLAQRLRQTGRHGNATGINSRAIERVKKLIEEEAKVLNG